MERRFFVEAKHFVFSVLEGSQWLVWREGGGVLLTSDVGCLVYLLVGFDDGGCAAKPGRQGFC
jgi:hypothetical protein